jgi:hypothetical protein
VQHREEALHLFDVLLRKTLSQAMAQILWTVLGIDSACEGVGLGDEFLVELHFFLNYRSPFQTLKKVNQSPSNRAHVVSAVTPSG